MLALHIAKLESWQVCLGSFPDLRLPRQWIAVVTKYATRRKWMTLVVTLFGVGSNVANADINWQTQLKTAHAQAQAEGKLLLLHFYDDNCVWCDRLEKGAFQSPEVAAAIDKNYVAVKIHAGKSPSIASTFKVSRFPTDVIVTTQGQALAHGVSPQDPQRYIAMLAQQAPTAPASSAIAAKSTASPTQMPVDHTALAAAAPIPSMSAGYAMPPSSSGTPVSAVSSRTDAATNPRASQGKAPSGSPELELSLDGYCSVTLIEKDRWVEGSPEFGVVHLGRLYLFSGKQEMYKFLANPEPYTPILNGIDVVRFFEERKIVLGNREWGLKDPDHNRMFFFADEAALNHFYNQHTRYTDAAIAVMAKAITDANPSK